jgi:hypothetical protein
MVHVLNFSVSPSRGFPPALIFGGFTTVNNLDIIFHDHKFKETKLTFEQISNQVNDLRTSLDNLHKLVSVEQEKLRTRGNYATPRFTVNFDIGDYVMFATRRNLQGPGRKSKPCWTGPYRVIGYESDWDFVLEHLVTKEKFHAHSSRIKFYRDKDLDVTADLKHQITHDEMRYKIEKITDHTFEDDEYKLFVKWQGFDQEESTWEPFEVIYEDVPSIVKEYVRNVRESDKLKNAFLSLI